MMIGRKGFLSIIVSLFFFLLILSIAGVVFFQKAVNYIFPQEISGKETDILSSISVYLNLIVGLPVTIAGTAYAILIAWIVLDISKKQDNRDIFVLFEKRYEKYVKINSEVVSEFIGLVDKSYYAADKYLNYELSRINHLRHGHENDENYDDMEKIFKLEMRDIINDMSGKFEKLAKKISSIKTDSFCMSLLRESAPEFCDNISHFEKILKVEPKRYLQTNQSSICDFEFLSEISKKDEQSVIFDEESNEFNIDKNILGFLFLGLILGYEIKKRSPNHEDFSKDFMKYMRGFHDHEETEGFHFFSSVEEYKKHITDGADWIVIWKEYIGINFLAKFICSFPKKEHIDKYLNDRKNQIFDNENLRKIAVEGFFDVDFYKMFPVEILNIANKMISNNVVCSPEKFVRKSIFED